MPDSGLFISYSTLWNARRQLGSHTSYSEDRRASLTGSAPLRRASASLETNGSPVRKQFQSFSGIAVSRRRQSHLGSATTPRKTRISPLPKNAVSPSVSSICAPISSQNSPDFGFPSLQVNSLRHRSPSTHLATELSLTHLKNNEYHDNNTLTPEIQSGHIEENSAVVAQVVASAVSKVQIEAQMEIHNLRNQLQAKDSVLETYKEQIETHTVLLRDLESTIQEFQTLRDQDEPDIFKERTLQYKLNLEERDRKILSLKSQLEERRAEFRETLDALQADMQDSSAGFVQEIKALQLKLKDADSISERFRKLEQYVRTMEESGMTSSSKVADKEAKAQITKFAELENKLLEKDHKIISMKEQLEETQQRLNEVLNQSTGTDKTNQTMGSNNYPQFERERLRIQWEEMKDVLAANEELKSQLKDEQEKRIVKEKSLNHLKEGLNTNECANETCISMKDKQRILKEQLTLEVEKSRTMEVQIALLESSIETGARQRETEALDNYKNSKDQITIQLNDEKAHSAILENEIKRLESVIKKFMTANVSIEGETGRQRDDTGFETHTEYGNESTIDPAPTPRQNLFSTSSGRETPPNLPIDTLLDELPIKSPKPVSALTGVSNITGTPAPRGLLSPTAVNIVTAITAAAANHSHSVKSPLASPIYSIKSKNESFMGSMFKSRVKADHGPDRDKVCGLCDCEGHVSAECPYEEEF